MPSSPHLLPGDPGGGRCAEVGEDAQCFPQRRFLRPPRRAGPSRRRTGSPGQSRCARPPLPVTLNLEPVRIVSSPCGAPVAVWCGAARQRSRREARRPQLAVTWSASPTSPPASPSFPSEPVRLGAGQPRGHDHLWLARPVSSRHRLVETFPGAGAISAPRPDLAEALTSGLMRLAGEAPAPPQQLLAQRRGLVPPAHLLQSAGPLCLPKTRGEGTDIVVVAVGDAVHEVPFGFSEPPLVVNTCCRSSRRPGRSPETVRDRDLQPQAQLARSPIFARGGPRGAALGVERVAQHLEHAERLGDRLRPQGQPHRLLLAAAAQHPLSGEIGCTPRPAPRTGAERFEGRQRGLGRGDCVATAAQAPPHRAREPAHRIALAQPVTRRTPQRERSLTGIGGGLPAGRPAPPRRPARSHSPATPSRAASAA